MKNYLFIVAVTIACAGVVAFGLIPVDGGSAGPAKSRELFNCFWVGPVVAPGPYNGGYPDTGGVYWYAEYQLPPGAKLMLRGEFAHARYHAVFSEPLLEGDASRGRAREDPDDQSRWILQQQRY